MKILVAIPTYNERENVGRMIESVLNLNENEAVRGLNVTISLVIIDDNSRDGTQEIIKGFTFGNQKRFPQREGGVREGNLFLISREKKLGLGTAYVAAFKFAIDGGFDYVITMDCDFSHNPDEIAGFINLMNNK
ncbi:MAG: glycosyltransferase, partial [Deltaproteobacteria bacterium]|nr:glycosyltransferase [Deltaproteobacteria bacterium]